MELVRLSWHHRRWGAIAMLFVLFIFVLHNLLAPLSVYVVQGMSMSPNFNEGERLIVQQYAFDVTPRRDDVVVLRDPLNTNALYLKRVVGLPYETVELRDEHVWVNGIWLPEAYLSSRSVVSDIFLQHSCVLYDCVKRLWQLGANEYFVLGDKRSVSQDSRTFGVINQSDIIGRVILRYSPWDVFTLFPAP
jgi:signal peptidase I